ncbi:21685_t:CDS:2 [Entrophospora sp. SA101]|nr:21685_t:CDS:2 [Entrophospora sp. SA101]
MIRCDGEEADDDDEGDCDREVAFGCCNGDFADDGLQKLIEYFIESAGSTDGSMSWRL